LNGWAGPSWDVSRRVLNLMEENLSTYYRCTLSAITHKSNFSGHVDMYILSCFGMWNLCPSLSAPFSYILYMYIFEGYSESNLRRTANRTSNEKKLVVYKRKYVHTKSATRRSHRRNWGTSRSGE
jgi:hypothetical protein